MRMAATSWDHNTLKINWSPHQRDINKPFNNKNHHQI
jgi:hypothetical protein